MRPFPNYAEDRSGFGMEAIRARGREGIQLYGLYIVRGDEAPGSHEGGGGRLGFPPRWFSRPSVTTVSLPAEELAGDQIGKDPGVGYPLLGGAGFFQAGFHLQKRLADRPQLSFNRNCRLWRILPLEGLCSGATSIPGNGYKIPFQAGLGILTTSSLAVNDTGAIQFGIITVELDESNVFRASVEF